MVNAHPPLCYYGVALKMEAPVFYDAESSLCHPESSKDLVKSHRPLAPRPAPSEIDPLGADQWLLKPATSRDPSRTQDDKGRTPYEIKKRSRRTKKWRCRCVGIATIKLPKLRLLRFLYVGAMERRRESSNLAAHSVAMHLALARRLVQRANCGAQFFLDRKSTRLNS